MSHIENQKAWQRSPKGRTIELHKFLCDDPQLKILILGGMHGDEPEGVTWAEEWITLLDSLPKQKIDWFAIPCLNPDGYYASPRSRTNSQGVDLNRNFSSSDWTRDSRGPRYNPGTKPRCAPEVDALSSLIEQHKFNLIIHFHSHSEACVILTSNAPNEWAECLAKATNTPFKEDIGYATPGSLGQWAGLGLGIPVVCVEELEGRSLTEVRSNAKNAFRALGQLLEGELL
ncbi:MAG: DUF2817 domain-containing protein [Bdellovibrionales bacterium CG10_big_fil_rev_8_21_14_0_10_45_34]|nr:MAG: DUF2817 domain-containing protein [Bdellovibrionales bacterium CG10_big_fil_rev_8_21_14_0_10_45_34]